MKARTLRLLTLLLTILAWTVIAIIFWPTAAHAGTGYLSGSRIDGMVQICYYDTTQGTVAITIPATEICPLTIEV